MLEDSQHFLEQREQLGIFSHVNHRMLWRHPQLAEEEGDVAPAAWIQGIVHGSSSWAPYASGVAAEPPAGRQPEPHDAGPPFATIPAPACSR